MVQKVLKAFQESSDIKERFARENAETVLEVSRLIASAFNDGKKLVLFGNGGSAANACHIAAEFMRGSKKERPGLPAIALNTDNALLTALSRDYDFSEVFSRQIKTMGEEGDVAIVLSTSGNSPNILKAIEAAKKKKIKVVVFTGAKGDKLAQKSNYSFIVQSDKEPRIHEVHITLGHVICQMVDEILFDAPRKA